MSANTFMSFAYGSNMSTARLRDRCPSSMPLGVAQLIGYQLRWHKRSRDGSGKCDIVTIEKPSARAFGVLYRIASSEKDALNKAEGLGPSSYMEIEVLVRCNADTVYAKAYQATSTAIDGNLKPYSWYHALVIAGAKEHRLPENYIAQLQLAVTQEDLDRERHDQNMNLIKGVPA